MEFPNVPEPSTTTPNPKFPMPVTPSAGPMVLPNTRLSNAFVETKWIPGPYGPMSPFPEMTFRSAGSAPPMTWWADSTSIPPHWFPRAVCPVASVPMKFPMTRTPRTPSASTTPNRENPPMLSPRMIVSSAPARTRKPSAFGPAVCPAIATRMAALSPTARVFGLDSGWL